MNQYVRNIIYLSIISIGIFVCISFISHLPEIRDAIRIDNAFGGSGVVIIATLSALLTHGGMGTFWVTALYSLALGVNIILLCTYYQKHGLLLRSTSSAGIAGAVIGVLGIGCAACGTLALTAVLSLVGLGSLVAFLPYAGLEFYVIGIVLLIISSLWLGRLIKKPLVC